MILVGAMPLSTRARSNIRTARQLLQGLAGDGQISVPRQKSCAGMLFYCGALHRVKDYEPNGQRRVKEIQRFTNHPGTFTGEVQKGAFHGCGGGCTGAEDVGA